MVQSYFHRYRIHVLKGCLTKFVPDKILLCCSKFLRQTYNIPPTAPLLICPYDLEQNVLSVFLTPERGLPERGQSKQAVKTGLKLRQTP